MISSTTKSILLTKPIKEMPKGLIYNHKNKDIYKLISLKDKKVVGEMRAYPIKNDKPYYKNEEKKDYIFHISSLDIFEKMRNQGWGEIFINFAKKESFNKNCKGKISLVAYNYEKSPHAFYKKHDFVTLDDKTNKILDEYVKNHWIPFHWDAMEMYLPLEKINKPTVPILLKPENKFISAIKSFLELFKLC